MADQQTDRIQIWFNNSINPTRTIGGGFSSPYAIFVTTNGDIYIDNGQWNGQVDKWALNTSISVPVMNVRSACYGLFVDINNILYCSMHDRHQIVTQSLNSDSNMITIVAGTYCSGSTSNALYNPYGIFVNTNFDLYVADCGNNRIQLFQSGQLNAITVSGNILLSCPTDVVLDADDYLFIVDQGNNRIVRLGPNGFQCLVGCYGSGLASNTLYSPQSMAFDSYGNIFVTDSNNNRVQKFILLNTTNSKYYRIKKII